MSAIFDSIPWPSSTRNVLDIIDLLKVSHTTKISPLTIFALHFIGLTGRSSAMFIVHSTRKFGAHNPSRAQADSNLIINALEAFENDNHLVIVQPLTAMSPYRTMHEDICSLAKDRRVALILLPFQKHPTVDGRMEDKNVAYRGINLNVLANAPCSMGIFIDRELARALRLGGPNDIVHCRFALLFIGGPDDRKALAYAWRMASHLEISLTVVRFLPGENVVDIEPGLMDEGHKMLSNIADSERKTAINEDCINLFRLETKSAESVNARQ
ncbi:Cation/H(+) antiporter 15 [Morella rubra]|uniref:Cation/H(+) antiporter 15 n=1 Tax=Morella rubra TaxID=262757 RepID=A0A6A1VF94_9ROSI|nr:Cation/H(+) antiporter 15 [Morella rubra]